MIFFLFGVGLKLLLTPGVCVQWILNGRMLRHSRQRLNVQHAHIIYKHFFKKMFLLFFFSSLLYIELFIFKLCINLCKAVQEMPENGQYSQKSDFLKSFFF